MGAMTKHVARRICAAAGRSISPVCIMCGGNDCSMWESFVEEAREAIEAVKDYARLEPRVKPRQRVAA